MKSQILSISIALMLVACGQEQAPHSQLNALSPTPPVSRTLQDPDAKTLSDIMVRSGLTKSASIETSLVSTDAAFCTSGVNPNTQLPVKLCQFSVGGGLFVRANGADTDTFINILRQNKAIAKKVANGRRWDLRQLECASRFVVAERKLVTTCNFQQ